MYNILIVEDEYLSRYVLNSIICKEFKNNVNVILAENGLKAKEIIEREQIDLGIIDMNIPSIKGIEICKLLRIKYHHIPILITTDDYDTPLSEKILNLNINEYLVKPLDLSHIGDMLRKYIKINIDNVKKDKNYLNIIVKNFIKGNKKETINVTKEYIEYLYTYDDLEYHKSEIIGIINQIKWISENGNIYIKQSTYERLNNFKENSIMYIDKDKIIKEFEEIYNEIFGKINSGNDYDSNQYIKEAINYVEKNIRKNITLDEVAQYINITPHYLSKIFKKQVGINFITYITNRKIELAKKMLLEEDEPIVNIAIELSYNQPNYFSKVFKKIVGVTPSEYRQQQLKNNNYMKI